MFLLKAFSNLHTNSQQFFMHEIFLKINLKILENLFWSNILFALTPLKLPSNRNVVEWYIQIVTKSAKFQRFLKVNVTTTDNSAASVAGRQETTKTAKLWKTKKKKRKSLESVSEVVMVENKKNMAENWCGSSSE